MKIIEIEEKISKDLFYECEVCGEQSKYKEHIEKCEKQHICKHEDFVYEFSSSDDNWIDHVIGIGKRCRICDYDIDGLDFQDIVTENDQVKIEKAFDILTNNL